MDKKIQMRQNKSKKWIIQKRSKLSRTISSPPSQLMSSPNGSSRTPTSGATNACNSVIFNYIAPIIVKKQLVFCVTTQIMTDMNAQKISAPNAISLDTKQMSAQRRTWKVAPSVSLLGTQTIPASRIGQEWIITTN